MSKQKSDTTPIVKPTLTEKEIAGPSPVDSPKARELLADFSLAKDALAKADASELFSLYERAIRDRNEISDVLLKLSTHLINPEKSPRYESEHAIEAMEHVALAAIDLVKAIVCESKKP